MSTEEVAAILGVGVSTVKRWVDRETLPASRTCGGHRRILLSDVLRLARRGRLPGIDLAQLPLMSDRVSARSDAELKSELHAALIRGDETAVRSLFANTYQAGMPIEVLADDILRPTLHRIGQEWSTGQIDVMHEHVGVQACYSALCELKHLLLSHAEPAGPIAVGGAPEKDHYVLPGLLAELVLIDAGWQVVNLGPNTPLASFERALDERRPRMLWLSVSHLEDPAGFLTAYRALHRAAVGMDVAVALGGRALTNELRAVMPYTAFGDGLRNLAAFAHTLHPRPKPPQRGRPPQGQSDARRD